MLTYIVVMKRLPAVQAESRVVTRSKRKDNRPVSFNVVCLRLEFSPLCLPIKLITIYKAFMSDIFTHSQCFVLCNAKCGYTKWFWSKQTSLFELFQIANQANTTVLSVPNLNFSLFEANSSQDKFTLMWKDWMTVSKSCECLGWQYAVLLLVLAVQTSTM